ncbi:MAG TPA: NAD(P)-binding domain-containing protein [Candidatus Limnocylindrales bacterium]|jgi:NADPH-dependent F420 reductase|nr:NAD(P)-binding domain-containing protein [Candidatus Limnocylindrales bacterium]
MDIAIIGAGNVGKSLATAFTRAGHNVIIASRDPEDAGSVAAATGARVARSNAEAAAAAEVVVLAVPFASAPDVAAEIAPSVAGKPVVDATNRMSFGAAGPDIDTTSSNAEDLAALLPDARIVKAFNTLFAANQADPIAEGIQLDGYVAADDDAARATVLELVRSIGLDPVDVGELARARQLEAMAFLNIYLQIVRSGTWQSGWKLVGAPKPALVAA